jgi:hypothetical protein
METAEDVAAAIYVVMPAPQDVGAALPAPSRNAALVDALLFAAMMIVLGVWLGFLGSSLVFAASFVVLACWLMSSQ